VSGQGAYAHLKKGQRLAQQYQCTWCRREVYIHLDRSEYLTKDHDLTARFVICEDTKCGGVLERQSGVYKFCSGCGRWRPATVKYFANCDGHRGGMPSPTGLSGNCLDCKQNYNRRANKLRIPEQHRESRESRKFFQYLVEDGRLPPDTLEDILERFGAQCFRCAQEFREGLQSMSLQWDHTRPLAFGWPLDMYATPLCGVCNGEKSDKWPSEFYTPAELCRLATLTGLSNEDLDRKRFNPVYVTRFYEYRDSLFALAPAEVSRIERRLRRAGHYPPKHDSIALF
jgi:hypothetical protein